LAPLSITLYLVADDGIGARAEALNLRRTVNRRRRADMDSEGCRSASPQSVDG
jgi:hypothetical protein